jgi:hypothetical protein
MKTKTRVLASCLIVIAVILYSCYKKQIDFGDSTQNNYTSLAFVDTIGVRLSTVVTDSFATNSATSLLVGRYKDPYLGIVSTKAFFQLSYPGSVVNIPSSAVFDSLVFIVRTNHYYYGDTSRPQTISIHELSETISYSYNSKLYNTSNVNENATPLGSRTMLISPAATDSIVIRLSNAKGQEIFTKLQQQTAEVTQPSDFLNYFKGISISVGTGDTSAAYGLTGSTSMAMRLVYHLTTPYVQSGFVDFPMQVNDLAFNQVLSDRSGTGLPSSGFAEILSTQTADHAFSQYGAGLLAKMTFPSLRDIIRSDKIVTLLKAELIIRPAAGSFDNNKYKLPTKLFMYITNGANAIGQPVEDSVKSGVDYENPVIDAIYGENTYYRFNITSYIGQMLTTAGSTDDGFFLLQSSGSSSMNVNRVVINDANRSNYKTQLLLTVLIVNK